MTLLTIQSIDHQPKHVVNVLDVHSQFLPVGLNVIKYYANVAIVSDPQDGTAYFNKYRNLRATGVPLQRWFP